MEYVLLGAIEERYIFTVCVFGAKPCIANPVAVNWEPVDGTIPATCTPPSKSMVTSVPGRLVVYPAKSGRIKKT